MANHALPAITDTYTSYTSNINARIDDVIKMMDSTQVPSPTNVPTQAVRWNTSTFNWQRFNGTDWTTLAFSTGNRFDININGTVGATTPAVGAFTTLSASSTISGTGFSTYLASPPAIGGTAACPAGTFTVLTVSTTCTLPAAATVTGGGTIVGNTATQTLSNKTLSSPVIGTIINTGTLTLPTATTILVGTNTTDTLTNKTLTSPRIGTSILDTGGFNILTLTPAATVATYLNISTGLTGVAPAITALGEANTSLNLKSTGTGTVQANGLVIVDVSSTQTLTNKTITGTFTGNITGNVTGNATGSSGSCTGNSATATTASALTTTNNYQMAALGVGVSNTTAGSILATGNITAFGTSDTKFKTNVTPVEDALSKVLEIGCKEFDWTDEYISTNGGADGYFVVRSDFGVIAQDVQRVFPKAVRTREDGSLAVDYQKLAILAFGAISELANRVQDLERK